MAADIQLIDSAPAGPESVAQALRVALAQCEAGERKANKVVILFLDDTDKKYNIGHVSAGITCSQMIALFQIYTQKAMGWMGY